MGIERADLAIRLVEERARMGFSQADFARQSGITREGLRLYESGQRGVGAEFLAQTATLGLDVQYILTGVRSINLAEAGKAAHPVSQSATSVAGNVVQVAHGGVANVITTPKHVTHTTAIVKPGDEHISEAEAAKLTALVNEIIELEGQLKKSPRSARAVWSALNAHCKVTRYRLIALGDYDKAEKYLRQWIGRLNSMSSAPVADNMAWRKRRYAYIKINTKDDEQWLSAYLRKSFKAESLTGISDDALDKTYRAVASRKRKKDGKT